MNKTDKLLSEMKDVLENNILKFWSSMKDPDGGYYGRMTADGSIVKDATRGAILNARLLWTWSRVSRVLQKKECFQESLLKRECHPAVPQKQDYLQEAIHAKDYFVRHFLDHKYGGVYWSVDSKGERLTTKAQLYAQGFAIYALSEFYAASKDDDSLKAAVNIFRIVEKEFADHANGGYIEALDRDFSPLEDMRLSDKDINCQKTMNSHLHLLEGYANLYKVWPDPLLKEKIVALLDIVGTKIMNPQTGHLELYFDKEWRVVSGGQSYGHDIETSWLALECAMAIKDIEAMDKARAFCKRLYQAALEGLQADGSLVYETAADGRLVSDRHWWVQAEAVVGHLWAWKYLGVDEGAQRAIDAWDYISTHLVDREGGDWWWSCDDNGIANTTDDKAGEWKCPYHNSRMCVEVLNIFD